MLHPTLRMALWKALNWAIMVPYPCWIKKIVICLWVPGGIQWWWTGGKVHKEIQSGRIIGPLKIFHWVIYIYIQSDCSKIWWGLENDHLSYPESCGVNQFIEPNLCTVQYSSFDSVVNLILKLSKGTLLGKGDV